MGPPKMSYPIPQTPWIWWDNCFIESCYVTWHHWVWNWKIILGYLRRFKVIPWVLKSREFSLADGREVRNIQSIVTTVVLQLRGWLYSVTSIKSSSLWLYGLKPSKLLCPWEWSRQEYWSELPCPPPGDLPKPGIEPTSLMSLLWEAQLCFTNC